MASRFLIFLIAMGADYSFELISIETYAPQFIGHNKIFLDSVTSSGPEQVINYLNESASRFYKTEDQSLKYPTNWQ